MSFTDRGNATAGRNVVAVLGPTNTGKTHLAIERMLAHPNGIIGLPLRLLAREVYSKIAARIGADQVALITGEEKIMPPSPRFRVCTVEAMPVEPDASFVAVDEIQIAGDLERGHVFTDRLLRARGRDETLLLGAATMRGIVERLLPGVNIVTRPRMSVLAHAGAKKITRLPARSAVVAFSADEVYAIAELIRRQRGGAAVVLGSLSPRTRNAQVELFQSGDVDFLVATDAIGMGLNLDVDHVAFAADRKFDGYQFRRLTAAELGQIAGRAGRHMRNGTFGTTGRVEPFSDEMVEALETHHFDNVKTVQWRNSDLDFASLETLAASLDVAPNREGLVKAPPSDDVTALETAARDPAVREMAAGRQRVALLWDVCQVPDYRKIAPANHAELVATLFQFLARNGAIPEDWFAEQTAFADRTEGDIDTLSNRIAHIRTWTFVANRPDWLADPRHWQERTRAIEDRLSDALHERLIGRFVDRRTSVLMRRLKENAMLEAEVTPAGDVLVEGQHVGALAGFRFTPDASADGPDAKALRAAAQKALSGEIAERAERVATAANGDILLAADGTLRWRGAAVAKITDGDDPLRPRVILLADEALSGPVRDRVQARLDLWLANHAETLLKPLFDLRAAETLSAPARGLAFRLVEAFGVIDRAEIAEEVKALDQETRAGLRSLGVRFGAYNIFVPQLLKPAPAGLLAILWSLKHGGLEENGARELAQLAASGRTSVVVDPAVPRPLYRVVGYRIAGPRAVRVDILERLADVIRPLIAWRPTPGASTPPPGAAEGNGFMVTPAMTSLLGCAGEDFAAVLKALGYRVERRPAPARPAEPTQATEAAVAAALATGDAPIAQDLAALPAASNDNSPTPVAVSDGEAAAAPAPDPAAEPAAAAPAAAAEPAFIEIWRPGRRVDQHPQHRRLADGHEAGGRARRNRGPRHRADIPATAAQTATSPAEAAGAQPGEAPGAAPPSAPGPSVERPPRERGRSGDGRPHQRGDRNRERNNKGPGPERAPFRQPERAKAAFDPDSPFAALAALKAQLEGRKQDDNA
ncbi:MAG TPA: helicase-related protein [Bauldia sp.]|nr:helicase-related protein [Bauldia sp.]